jgi:general secretion pathway protein F
MAEFSYIARDNSGEKVTGTITAATRREAVAAIAGRALFPIEVIGASGQAAGKRLKRVPAQLLAVTYGQLADLLRSGVPLLRALDVLRKQSLKPAMIEVLNEVHHEVEQGSSLAEAMAKYPKVFGEMAVSMVRAGGEGGFLEGSLGQVAQFTEAQDEIKSRTLGALAYPILLMVIGSAIFIGLLVFFVPKFDSLFTAMRERGELPWLTDAVLSTSRFLQDWGLAFAGLIVFAVLVARHWLAGENGRLWRDRAKIRMPILGSVFLNFAVARFCRVLGTLLHNGVPILRSLEISADSTANRVLSAAIVKASENISAGQRLAGPLGAEGYFPTTVVEMIAVAEEANTLETVLVDIADVLERRTWRRLDVAVRMIEPMMLMFLAGCVLVMVIALLMPVIRMSGMMR